MLTSVVSILGDKWKGLYDPAGRGFPDVAALGVRYAVKKRDPKTGKMGVSLLSGTRYVTIFQFTSNQMLENVAAEVVHSK